MKRTNYTLVVARLMLIVLTLAITVFSFASCDSLPPELQGLLGGNPNASCEHEYDNACDTDCNICGATRTVEPDNTRYTITEEEWNAALKLRNFTYIQATPAPGVEYKLTETAIHLSSGSNNMYSILKDGITYGSEDGVNWKAYNDNFDSVSESYVLEHMIGHYGVTFTKFLEVYEYSEESKSYVRALANGGTAEFSFADGKLVSFIANGQTPVQITNVGTTVVEYSAFNIVDEIKPTCQHANVENCVCKDCNEAVHTNVGHEPANPPDCNTPGNIECYGCNDCNKLFSDAECKNEITMEEALIPAIGEHKMVGGVCEFCGTTNPNGGGGNDGSNDSQGPDYVPTSLELAVQALNELYGKAYQLVTTSDYELVSKIVIDGEEFTVTWVIANESITLTYDEARGVYLVDIPDDIPDEYGEDLYYSIVATISDGEGQSEEHLYKRVLKPAENR